MQLEGHSILWFQAGSVSVRIRCINGALPSAARSITLSTEAQLSHDMDCLSHPAHEGHHIGELRPSCICLSHLCLVSEGHLLEIELRKTTLYVRGMCKDQRSHRGPSSLCTACKVLLSKAIIVSDDSNLTEENINL